MADLGTLLTDERMKILSRKIDKVFREALNTAKKNEKRWIDRLISLPEDTPQEKRIAFANEVVRRGEQVKQIANEINKAGETAALIIQAEMSNIYGLNYEVTAFELSKQIGLPFFTTPSTSFTIYDKNQLAVLVQKEQGAFTKLAYNNLKNNPKVVQTLQNQLMQSVVLGESQQKIIQRIRVVTGQSIKQAKRVAQTERTRVQSQGRQMGLEEAHAIGIDTQKMWVSRMDDRVRDSHAWCTGEIVDYDQKFSNGLMYPGDPDGEPAEVVNCRCVYRPMVKSLSPALARYREQMRKDYGFVDWKMERIGVDRP